MTRLTRRSSRSPPRISEASLSSAPGASLDALAWSLVTGCSLCLGCFHPSQPSPPPSFSNVLTRPLLRATFPKTPYLPPDPYFISCILMCFQENSSLSSKARDPTHASAFHDQEHHPPTPNLGDTCNFQLLILPWEVIERTTIFQTKKQVLLPQNLACFHSLNANRLFTRW